MAIASLHDVPVLESSILRESQSSSSGNQGRVMSTRTSSILRMWRELEDECVVNLAREGGRSRLQCEGSDQLSNCTYEEDRAVVDLSEIENGSMHNFDNQIDPVNENEDKDHQSVILEQSQDFGEVERERVRQIFQEWKNSGVNVRTPNNRSSRAQWLGENELERVRNVREWIQKCSQQTEDCIGNRNEQVVDIGSQVERIRDGHVLDHSEGQVHNRRGIRRLCGRQALVDLLAKKEQERRRELHGLEAARPVSCFAHRNRIQSLLRLRCFQNMRSAESSRSTSAAERELGLLRQRQTVSGLRDNFLSRLDNSVHVQATNLSDGPLNDIHGLSEQPGRASRDIEVLTSSSEQNECDEDDNVSSSVNLNQYSGCLIGESVSQELFAQVEVRLDHSLDDECSRQETAATSHLNSSSQVENEHLNSEEPSRNRSDLEQSHDMVLQQYDAFAEDVNPFNQLEDLEAYASEELNGQDSSTLVEEWHQAVEIEERFHELGVLSNQSRNEDSIEEDSQLLPSDPEESSHGALDNDAGTQIDAHEGYWQESSLQETPRDWLEAPNGNEATSSGRMDIYYFSDDENIHNLELRELLNRRRVSSLLQSGFRESLDQLIRSYVERQSQAPDDWEVQETSPPVFASSDRYELGADQFEGIAAANGSPHMAPTTPLAPPDHTNLFNHDCYCPGAECEIINDLRMDIARVQQRLNNMQRMLETCMDMQLELQRSVRQEVSAALNRSIKPSDSLETILRKDSSKWDWVRKGICCMCSDKSIDSLLYRCGHMCTCTKCSSTLLQGKGKCPMCLAPVIEVIQAYFTQ